MSDLPLSDIDFKNKMAWVRTSLKASHGIQLIYNFLIRLFWFHKMHVLKKHFQLKITFFYSVQCWSISNLWLKPLPISLPLRSWIKIQKIHNSWLWWKAVNGINIILPTFAHSKLQNVYRQFYSPFWKPKKVSKCGE